MGFGALEITLAAVVSRAGHGADRFVARQVHLAQPAPEALAVAVRGTLNMTIIVTVPGMGIFSRGGGFSSFRVDRGV